MLADLDLLLIAVFAAADDLLPDRHKNARRSVTDAEVVTLAVAQAIMDVPSDREFLAVAARRLGLFSKLPLQPGYWKCRRRCSEHIDWLTAMFAQDSPGYTDSMVLIDSTPAECGRSVDTARRSALGPGCAHHDSRSHSRWFWGMLAAPARGTGIPRSGRRPGLGRREGTRGRAAALRARPARRRAVIADKGYAGKDFESAAAERFGAGAAATTQGRAGPRTAPRADPPMHREHLLDAQEPPRPRAPPRPHHARTPSPHRRQTARPRRRRLAQPLPRSTPTSPRRPRHLTTTTWNQPSSGSTARGGRVAGG